MKVTIVGRHFDVTPSVREYAESKVERLGRFFERLGDVRVTLGSEGQELTAEIVVGAPKGAQLVGEARGETVYAAVDLAIDKVERQVTRHKERLNDHRGGRAGRS